MTLVRNYDAATAAQGAWRHVLGIFGYPVLVWRNRFMVQNFLRRDLMNRVNGSFLGVGWMLLQPMFLFAVYFLVFGVFFDRTGQGPDAAFAIYLFSGVIVFHALAEATTQCCTLIVDNGNLVKKVAFPAEALLVPVAASSIVTYLVGAIVCLVAGLATGVARPGWLLLAWPLVIATQFLFVLGVGLVLANLYVFVRDIAQLWRIVVMAWMFLSPVFWGEDQLGSLPEWARTALTAVNPAFPLIQAHRLVLGGDPAHLGAFWPQYGVATAWAAGVFVLGYAVFMSRKHKYSDLI
jgi:lipopolysaccharide transport system permease protein